MTSSSPSINPAMFDTPEKKAKVFFDHEARVVGTKIVVTHHTLRRDFPLKDAATATRLDQLMSSVDWAAMKQKVAAEEPSEGATQFSFKVIRGDVTTELQTANLETYPELTEIVKVLKETVGHP